MCLSQARAHTRMHAHKHSVNVWTMILSRNMINHCIFAERGQCYHGDIKGSTLLCISTEQFTTAPTSPACVRSQRSLTEIHFIWPRLSSLRGWPSLSEKCDTFFYWAYSARKQVLKSNVVDDFLWATSLGRNVIKIWKTSLNGTYKGEGSFSGNEKPKS